MNDYHIIISCPPYPYLEYAYPYFSNPKLRPSAIGTLTHFRSTCRFRGFEAQGSDRRSEWPSRRCATARGRVQETQGRHVDGRTVCGVSWRHDVRARDRRLRRLAP